MKKQINVKCDLFPTLWVYETEYYYQVIKGTESPEYFQKESYSLDEALKSSLGENYRIK